MEISKLFSRVAASTTGGEGGGGTQINQVLKGAASKQRLGLECQVQLHQIPAVNMANTCLREVDFHMYNFNS